MNILVLEASTTSAKAMMYNTTNKTFEVETRPYNFAESEVGLQDPLTIFTTTIEVGRQVCHSKKVDAIALSCTFHAIMLCNREMVPQSPLYQWTFTGASLICRELRRDESYVSKFYNTTGCMVNAIYPFFKLKLLRQNGRKLENYKIVDQGVYNMYRLTGECITTDVVASGTGLLNTKKRDFDDALLAELGITRDNLAELVKYDSARPLNAEAATLLGIEPGVPVLPSLSDGALNQVGSGALKAGTMTFSVGTSGAMRISVPEPVVPEKPSTWCYLSPTGWMSGAATSGCTNCLDWCKDQFFHGMDYDQIELGLKADREPPVFLPFFFGERCPGWEDERLGGFLDIKPQHTVYDMYNGALEGIMYNLYQCYEALTKLNGQPKRIKLSGGILKSPYWLQMCADIFGVPMELDPATHASVMGGVAVAMEKLGLISCLTEMEVPFGKLTEPNSEMIGVYRERYDRYLHWYEKSM